MWFIIFLLISYEIGGNLRNLWMWNSKTSATTTRKVWDDKLWMTQLDDENWKTSTREEQQSETRKQSSHLFLVPEFYACIRSERSNLLNEFFKQLSRRDRALFINYVNGGGFTSSSLMRKKMWKGFTIHNMQSCKGFSVCFSYASGNMRDFSTFHSNNNQHRQTIESHKRPRAIGLNCTRSNEWKWECCGGLLTHKSTHILLEYLHCFCLKSTEKSSWNFHLSQMRGIVTISNIFKVKTFIFIVQWNSHQNTNESSCLTCVLQPAIVQENL